VTNEGDEVIATAETRLAAMRLELAAVRETMSSMRFQNELLRRENARLRMALEVIHGESEPIRLDERTASTTA
jgi:hypothetical protein